MSSKLQLSGGQASAPKDWIGVGNRISGFFPVRAKAAGPLAKGMADAIVLRAPLERQVTPTDATLSWATGYARRKGRHGVVITGFAARW